MYVVKVKECIPELVLRKQCDRLFNYIESLPDKHIVVDFEDFELCSRAFIHQYLMNKQKSKKKIEEANINNFIADMIDIVKKSIKNNLP